jgi:hypothetical protein
MDDFFLATEFDSDQYVNGRTEYRTSVAHLRAHRTTWHTNLLAGLPAGSNIRIEASSGGRFIPYGVVAFWQRHRGWHTPRPAIAGPDHVPAGTHLRISMT